MRAVVLVAGLVSVLLAGGCAHTKDPLAPPEPASQELDKDVENALNDCVAICQPQEAKIAKAVLEEARVLVKHSGAKPVVEPLALSIAESLNKSRATADYKEVRGIYENLHQQLAALNSYTDFLKVQERVGWRSLRARFPQESVCQEEQIFRPALEQKAGLCALAAELRKKLKDTLPLMTRHCLGIESLLRARRKITREEGIQHLVKLQGFFDFPMEKIAKAKVPEECGREVGLLLDYRKRALSTLQPLYQELEAYYSGQ